jgi:hypothetical protein
VGENIIDPISWLYASRIEGERRSIQQMSLVAIAKYVKVIPIYFIPLHVSDRGLRMTNRDYPLWYIMYGIYTANSIMRRISGWVLPQSYYVAFPYGIYPTLRFFYSPFNDLMTFRQAVAHHTSSAFRHVTYRFSFQYGESHITNGNPMGFTLDNPTFELLRTYIVKLGFKYDEKIIEGFTSKIDLTYRKRQRNSTVRDDRLARLTQYVPPISERHRAQNDVYSHRVISLKEFFGAMKRDYIQKYAQVDQVPYYHEIKDWKSYQAYMGFMEQHKDENKGFQFFDTKPNFQRYIRLGRFGFEGKTMDWWDQHWNDLDQDGPL